MLKNKDILSLIALVLAVLALAAAVFAIASLSSTARQLEQLTLDNRNLQQQLSTLAASQGQLSADAYCHLIINGWEGSAGELSLTSAIAQVVLPGGSEQVMVQSSSLVLRKGIEELSRKPVVLVAAESSSSFEALLENVRFELPALAEGSEVDVWLEVVLSDGQILLSPYCSWFLEGGELLMVAG